MGISTARPAALSWFWISNEVAVSVFWGSPSYSSITMQPWSLSLSDMNTYHGYTGPGKYDPSPVKGYITDQKSPFLGKDRFRESGGSEKEGKPCICFKVFNWRVTSTLSVHFSSQYPQVVAQICCLLQKFELKDIPVPQFSLVWHLSWGDLQTFLHMGKPPSSWQLHFYGPVCRFRQWAYFPKANPRKIEAKLSSHSHASHGPPQRGTGST